jgi:hypothetical protein
MSEERQSWGGHETYDMITAKEWRLSSLMSLFPQTASKNSSASVRSTDVHVSLKR